MNDLILTRIGKKFLKLYEITNDLRKELEKLFEKESGYIKHANKKAKNGMTKKRGPGRPRKNKRG